jgi:hypothetical protein
MSYQAFPLAAHFREPKIITGRVVGAATSAPTIPADTAGNLQGVPDSAATNLKIVRNTTGNCTYTFLDLPIGTLQSYDFWVVSVNNGTSTKFATFAPPGNGVYAFTVITMYANGTAVDLSTTEELHYQLWAKPTGGDGVGS